MRNKKTDRTKNTTFLSVTPVTTRGTTGGAERKIYPRAIMMQRANILERRIIRDTAEIKRLKAAIKVLGKQKIGD